MAGSTPSRRIRRLSLAVLVVAGLASVATSPAMRGSSTTYEEVLTLSAASPAATRHFSFDIVNRDSKLDTLVVLAGGYSTDPGKGSREDTPGVSVSVVPDPDIEGRASSWTGYDATGLSLVEACRAACKTGATVIVRLLDRAGVGSTAITTNLVIDLIAETSVEGTGPADIDLVLTNDADRAFQGAPTELICGIRAACTSARTSQLSRLASR